MLYYVLCVLKFKRNLLFVQKLIKDSNYEVHFFPTYCSIINNVTKEVKGVGQAKNGLYYLVNDSYDPLMLSNPSSKHICLNSTKLTKKPNDYALWHHRL